MTSVYGGDGRQARVWGVTRGTQRGKRTQIPLGYVPRMISDFLIFLGLVFSNSTRKRQFEVCGGQFV